MPRLQRGRGAKPSAGGGGGWARSALKERAQGPKAPGPLFCLAAPGRPTGPPRACQTPPPPVTAPSFLRLRATAVGPPEARWRGVAGCRWGAPAGRRRLAAGGPPGPLPAKRKSGGPAKGPGRRSFRALRALAAPPGGTLGSFPPFRTKRLFFRPFSMNKTSGPLPMSGPPA